MMEPEGTMAGHNEIEFRHTNLRSSDWRWRPMTVFEGGGPPKVVTFETLQGALAYVLQTEPDKTRIVLVDDGGGRQVVG